MIQHNTGTILEPTQGISLGDPQNCGEEETHRDYPSQGSESLKASLDLEVDDSHAPDYLLVTVNYGLYYQTEGWSRNSYTLKLYAGPDGELHYQTVAGDDRNLFSADGKAQAGSFLRYTHAYRVYFYSLATCKNATGKGTMAQQRRSLCLKTF